MNKHLTKPYVARQGDVLIIPAKIPVDAKKQTNKGDVVLAEGEVTGHAHRINSGAMMFKFNDKTYLRVTKGYAALTHEEHKCLKIPQGDYEIKIQTNYTPKGWERVQD